MIRKLGQGHAWIAIIMLSAQYQLGVMQIVDLLYPKRTPARLQHKTHGLIADSLPQKEVIINLLRQALNVTRTAHSSAKCNFQVLATSTTRTTLAAALTGINPNASHSLIAMSSVESPPTYRI